MTSHPNTTPEALDLDGHNRLTQTPAPSTPAQNTVDGWTRPWTPDRPNGRGGTTITVKRCCNGCGRSIGDVRDDEINAAIAGLPLPDVRDECGCATTTEATDPTCSRTDHTTSNCDHNPTDVRPVVSSGARDDADLDALVARTSTDDRLAPRPLHGRRGCPVSGAVEQHNQVTTRRVARKPHRCDSCGRPIRRGDVHLEHVAFPGHDALGLGATRPSRLRECAVCATRYGRDTALDPVPYDQVARDGLL